MQAKVALDSLECPDALNCLPAIDSRLSLHTYPPIRHRLYDAHIVLLRG